MVALKISDVLTMIFNLVLATILFSYHADAFHFDQFLNMRFKVTHFILFLFLILLWHVIFSFLGLYHSRRLSTLKREIKDVAKAITLFTFAIYIYSLFYRIEVINPVMLIGFWVGSAATTILTRIVLRTTLRWTRRRGRNLRHILIAGTNARAVRFARKIESRPELGYIISGFVDFDWRGDDEFNKTGYRLVSDYNGLAEFVMNNVVDEMFILLPVKSLYEETSRIINICENQGIIVKHLSNIFNAKLSNLKMEQIEDESIISHYTGSMKGWQVPVKWMLDKILSLLLLILLSPLFLLSAILIKIFSPGPALFIQERMGLNKRIFRLYKFRTMTGDAPRRQAELELLNEVSGPVFKIENDPRVTSIGKFLRKTSIDELPQLLNVLKGDMSIVGPRPLPLRDYSGFDHDWQCRRLSVRPGITCLWQTNGRSSIPFEKWMELDMQYIDQWSLWLDFKILAKTFPAVLIGIGAV